MSVWVQNGSGLGGGGGGCGVGVAGGGWGGGGAGGWERGNTGKYSPYATTHYTLGPEQVA